MSEERRGIAAASLKARYTQWRYAAIQGFVSGVVVFFHSENIGQNLFSS
jgi:hypothetical protein